MSNTAMIVVGGVVAVVIVGAIAAAVMSQPPVQDQTVFGPVQQPQGGAMSDVGAVAGAIGQTASSVFGYLGERQRAQSQIDAAANSRRQTELEAMVARKRAGTQP